MVSEFLAACNNSIFAYKQNSGPQVLYKAIQQTPQDLPRNRDEEYT